MTLVTACLLTVFARSGHGYADRQEYAHGAMEQQRNEASEHGTHFPKGVVRNVARFDDERIRALLITLLQGDLKQVRD